MGKKDLVVLVNCGKYAEPSYIEEYVKTKKLNFCRLGEELPANYRQETLIVDILRGRWGYGRGVFDIGHCGECHRDDAVIGVYDKSNWRHFENIIADAQDFKERRDMGRR